MKIRKLLLAAGVFLLTPALCMANQGNVCNTMSEDIVFASRQYSLMLDQIGRKGAVRIPKTIDKMSRMVYIPTDDWCSGFFAGSLYYLYRLTNDKLWLQQSKRFTEVLDSIQYLKWHHDVGFMIGSSYLNNYRLQPTKAYKKVIIQTAKSLCTRFRKGAGVIQSWNTDKGWQSKRGWTCPVIIDNMMNLELLFEATRLSGDSTFWNVAIAHADATLKNQFRPDGSCYHVVDYNPTTGEVLHRQTAQGYADNSAWARGQAWAVYGYTTCYRYTRNKKYLDRAVASYEMNEYLPDSGYATLADRIMQSLSTPEYRAPLGKNGCFLLMHSVGSIPHNNEIDVPLNYADYYFLEALTRRK